MKIFSIISLIITVLAFNLNAQVITADPEFPTDADAVTITFNATQGNGGLEGFTGDVYAHTGVLTNQSTSGSDWKYAPSWGDNNEKYKLTRIDTDVYELEIGPSIREYYGVATGETIQQLAFVFRGANAGDPEGKDVGGADIYYDVTDAGLALNFNSPINNTLYDINDVVNWDISTSQNADITMYVNGAQEKTASDTNHLDGDYTLSVAGGYWFKVVVEKDTTTIMDSAYVVTKTPTVQEALPAGARKGINYHEGDTSVTLVLETPTTNKVFAHVVGDFTNWLIDNKYQMKQTPDGKYFWLRFGNLTPQEEYVFQYWVDDDVKIGDPYADKVADPWNDGSIPESVYPDLPVYTKTEYQTATVLQTGQTPYTWAASEDTWVRPDLDNLVIYELHIRDFIETHSYSTMMDTLDYLKKLGVEAIELMPVSEFEGNSSWGYNPSYYFAVDKYYGHKDSLKKFIETAHQEGFAVILDMVLNHAYGQNAMAKLYWDGDAPAADNPWFNREYVGPYEWGSDFNHTSTYTQDFIDSVNTYWIKEYHFDGFRFDFTKGFTQDASKFDSYNEERLAILKRMADVIWDQDSTVYIILEHWVGSEEGELAEYGMKSWQNKTHDYKEAMIGSNSGSFSNTNLSSHVTYLNSHDEDRQAYFALNEGHISEDGSYDVKDPMVVYERKKMLAAFNLLMPGPKMIWQFDELGYDININFNGRTGEKPFAWGSNGLGYYEDPFRQHIYTAYSALLNLRKTIGAENLAAANTDNEYLSGQTRRLVFDLGTEGLVVLANFGVETANITPMFTQTGKWYDYFSGDSIEVTSTSAEISLKAGEWYVYTTKKYSSGFNDAVKVYSNPVTYSPSPFTKDTEITITFDASKASVGGTSGLVGASEVHMWSGIYKTRTDTVLSNVVAASDAQMTNVSGDIWEITLTPEDFYSITDTEEIYQIVVSFQNSDSSQVGLGFRNTMVYINVQSSEPMVTIEPEAFTIDNEITITFNSNIGNQGLINSNAVYMHTGVVLSDKSNPGGSDWEKVPGDWGDNSWGEMSPVDGMDGYWELTMTPKDFYDLADGDTIYWIAGVFRDADGATKGSDTPGEYDWGIIQDGGDVFIKNKLVYPDISSIKDVVAKGTESIRIYPNPAQDRIILKQPNVIHVSIINISGQVVLEKSFDNVVNPTVEISELENGLYIIKSVGDGNNVQAGKFLKVE